MLKHNLNGNIVANTITAKEMELPTTQTVSWNPNEYKITKIDTENGIIEFKKIKDE